MVPRKLGLTAMAIVCLLFLASLAALAIKLSPQIHMILQMLRVIRLPELGLTAFGTFEPLATPLAHVLLCLSSGS